MSGIFKKIQKSIAYRTDKNFWLKEKFNQNYQNYLDSGATTEEAYQELVQLYVATNGKFNEEYNAKLKKSNPPLPVAQSLKGVPGNFTNDDFKKVNATLNQNGYVHFDAKLSKELCDKLTQFALNTPSLIPPTYKEPVIYNPENPVAEIYKFNAQSLINNADIQQLITDPVLINFARNYFGCEPIFDFPAMWWSTAFKKEASSEAAQLFHFDLDRIKWLKVFFYINEVTLDNGPHCYIEGSHKVNAKPAEILNRGYVRVPDADLAPYYKPDAFKTVCGEAGSMFMGDTKCWHKGTPLKKGHRLVLEIEYTSSMFGANYPKMEVSNASQTFKGFCANNKTFATNLHFKK